MNCDYRGDCGQTEEVDHESIDDGELDGWTTSHRRLETDGGAADRWRADRTSGKDFVVCAGGGVKDVEMVCNS